MELFETEVWLRQMARLRDFVRKIGPRGFRAVLFRMVPKQLLKQVEQLASFRAVLFRMVPKLKNGASLMFDGFRAVLFRMVPKQIALKCVSKKVLELCCFEWFQNRRMTGKL